MATSLKEQHGSVGIYFNRVLGRGTYGNVCKAKCGQLVCAAKILDETLFKFKPSEKDSLARFEEECQLFSTIKHPNIVQHIGTITHPKTKQPILIMEMLDENLNSFLKQSTMPLPYHLQADICYDVSLALSHLHFNEIIHCQLTSNNVLLIGGGQRAKVSDFGMHKLASISSSSNSLTQSDGILAYMPPEASATPPVYTSKTDCFSYGVLTIEIITQNLPKTGSENRQKDIDEIPPDHPLLVLALDCLKDNPKERLYSDTLCELLVALRGEDKYIQSKKNNIKDKLLLKLKEKDSQLDECRLLLQNTINEHTKETEILTKKLEASESMLKECSLKLEKKEIAESEKGQALCAECERINTKSDDKDDKGLQDSVSKEEIKETNKPVVVSEDKHGDESHDFTVAMKWRQGDPAPETMALLYGTTVVSGNTAYISRHHNIYKYRLEDNEWSRLQQSQYQSFGLTVIDDQVTTVGGINRDQKRTRSLFSLAENSSQWKESYTPMPTHRVCPAVLTLPSHLVVAGGRNKAQLSTVEVMSRETKQWSTASSLPEPIGSPQISICGGDIFVCKHQSVYSSSVKDFLDSFYPATGNGAIVESTWSKIPNIPAYNGISLTVLGGKVLAIGGEDVMENAIGTIHYYDKETNSWSVEGEMPTPRADAMATVFPGDKLAVIGGWSESEFYNISEIGE